jgi:DNA polymerase-1
VGHTEIDNIIEFMELVPPAAADKVTGNTLLVIDGHAYAYRAFFAIQRLNSPSGAPTNAIYGFIKMLSKIHSWLRPTHQIVIWDGGLAADRMTALPEYKAQRAPMPADLEQQLDGICEYLAGAGITSHCHDGIEADDWIATVTRRAVEAGEHVVIASSDKDFMQLVRPEVSLLNPNDKTERVWNREMVLAKTGVAPEQIVDWLSLIGDAVDNIPGVPGIGPKTAAELVRKFGSVPQLYGRLAEVSSERLRRNLADAEGAVRRNLDLIRLNAGLPGDFEFEQCLVRPGNRELLAPLYSRWGFRTLLQEIEAEQPKQSILL